MLLAIYVESSILFNSKIQESALTVKFPEREQNHAQHYISAHFLFLISYISGHFPAHCPDNIKHGHKKREQRTGCI
jgi:hypothetical protein